MRNWAHEKYGGYVIALAIWLIFYLALKRYMTYRRKTQVGQEWRLYKAKLPKWVKRTETAIWIILLLPLSFAAMALLDGVYSLAHPHELQPNDVSSGLIAISSVLMALVPAMLLANTVSWLSPPIRKANLAAMQDFSTLSFRGAITGIAKFGSVTILFSLSIAVGAILAPWAK